MIRLLKLLFNLTSVVTSFIGVIYLFHRYQDYMNADRFERYTHQFDDSDSNESTTGADSSERSDLNEVYYRSMDPEEISESN